MRKIAFTLCLLLGSLTMHADNGKSLFVTFLDGSKIEFALADLPEVSFGEDKMKVQTSKTTATYELGSVKTFTYATTTGISQVINDKPFSMEGNTLIVDGTANKISCYTANGELITLQLSTADGKTIISLDTLKHGVYLIKINNKTIKIARQ